tara:strand:+ start:259 stop:447 length:189 start_codon:yes stop_codon:yes gene_type:complete
MMQYVDEVFVDKKAHAVFTIVPGFYRNFDTPPRLRLDVENTKALRNYSMADENLRAHGDRGQ